jgi:DNA-binding transcriptional LysR family regulator
MEPTPHAAELMRTLRKAEALLRKAITDRVVFDPANSDRMFRLCATDVAQLRLLPALMERLKGIAPAVRIDFRNITPSTPKLLQSGEADLALGFIPFMGAGFYQQHLFKERFVCAARFGHPRVVSELSLQQFQNEVHIAVVISATGHSIVEKLLEANKIHRNVGLRLPNLLGVGQILEDMDFLVIVPEQLGLIFAQTGRTKLFNLPFKTPTYLIRQHWRGVMASVYAELQQRHYGLRA